MIQQLLFVLRFQELLAFTLQADPHSSSPHLKGMSLYCNCSHGNQAGNKQTQRLLFSNPNHIREKPEASSHLRQLEISSFSFCAWELRESLHCIFILSQFRQPGLWGVTTLPWTLLHMHSPASSASFSLSLEVFVGTSQPPNFIHKLLSFIYLAPLLLIWLPPTWASRAQYCN